MTEEFLHHIWKFRLFNQKDLKTVAGEALEILKSGEHNFDAGPDFFNANLRIDNTEWAGNVELHIKSSDWEKHQHQTNKAYGNIILHVVFENDKQLFHANESPIPTLVLKNLIDRSLLEKYTYFKNSNDWIACEKSINRVPEFVISSWLERLLIERLEDKSNVILASLKLNNNNWEETFYQSLARNFGFKINAVPFELLAKSVSNATLAKHKNSLLQVEAVLFGTAGLLDKQFNDKYLQNLQNEYQFLKNKFSLQPLESHLWKFLRLRPANFPTIRLSQFAALIYQSEHLFSKVLETEQLNSLQKLLNVQVSDYWKTHYMLDKISTTRTKNLGKSACDILIINTLIPFLFVYGKYKKEDKYVERALAFLELILPEKNTIVAHFNYLGVGAKNAFRTQALLQLKNQYCNNKLCLHCGIGNNLLKN